MPVAAQSVEPIRAAISPPARAKADGELCAPGASLSPATRFVGIKREPPHIFPASMANRRADEMKSPGLNT
jgi:hypothetical protein